MLAGVALAATPAGTFIRNQASASFLAANGERVTVTSNLVETRVERVAGLALTANRAQRAAPGATVELPHTVRNLGNGDDAFALAAENLPGDNIDLEQLEIHADANGDGLADAGGPIGVTPTLVAGASFDIVVRTRVPAAATDGSIARVELVAVSELDGAIGARNEDALTVGSGAAVTVTKRLSARAGAAPSGPYSVTLSWVNEGDGVAGDLVLLDALPPGMSYVPGSGRWSGGGTPTDANPDDVHAGAVASLRWCAYDPSCTGLPEANVDADADSTNQVTAIVDYVPPGGTGTISFDVTIADGSTPGPLVNVAEFEHDVAIATVARARTNPVSFTVLGTPGVVANGSATSSVQSTAEPVTRGSAVAGAAVLFDNHVWNVGDAVDTFDIEVDAANATFPSGTQWRLLRGDAATPLLDTDGNGRVDTGPIDPGEMSLVVLELRLPIDAAGDNDGAGFEIAKTARSARDAAVFDAVLDRLDAIVPAGVDLTNGAPAGESGAAGEGVGPEAEAVTVASPDAAGEARFSLHVTHVAGPGAAYALDAFAAPTGGPDDGAGTSLPLPLPEGWTVRFEDPDTGTVLSTTRVLASGQSVAVTAVVTVPDGAPSGTAPVYFRATSANGAIVDWKHDAVSIGVIAALELSPDRGGQVEPGGSIVYAHRLASAANVTIDDIVLTYANAGANWSTELWLDANGDAALDPDDTLVTGALSLAPGEERMLLVRVSADASVPIGTANVTTVEARWNAGNDALSVQDRTVASLTNVVIRKLQAPDTGCDGAPDAGSSFAEAPIEVAPGNNCVVYRMEATNAGAETSYNVAILDATPPWTEYHSGATCSRTPCTLNAPSPGATGAVSAVTDELAPGASYALEFVVRVR